MDSSPFSADGPLFMAMSAQLVLDGLHRDPERELEQLQLVADQIPRARHDLALAATISAALGPPQPRLEARPLLDEEPTAFCDFCMSRAGDVALELDGPGLYVCSDSDACLARHDEKVAQLSRANPRYAPPDFLAGMIEGAEHVRRQAATGELALAAFREELEAEIAQEAAQEAAQRQLELLEDALPGVHPIGYQGPGPAAIVQPPDPWHHVLGRNRSHVLHAGGAHRMVSNSSDRSHFAGTR